MLSSQDSSALVRFILARLDEDQSALRKLAKAPASVEYDAVDSVGRLVAECAAKRHCVGSIQRLLLLRDLPTEKIVRDEAVVLLRALALPYASHSRYQSEWRMRTS